MRLDHEVGEVGTPREVDRQRPEAALRRFSSKYATEDMRGVPR